MAKLYSEKHFSENLNKLEPTEDTVQFILNYSKALRVINCNKLTFEMLQN
ncbi:hypothetical protein [Seonamhaeicola algicola]|nr:hypothetical protein [Seonamhaeicola algicola]